MNHIACAGSITKLLVLGMLAVSTIIPSRGASAAEAPKASCSAPDHSALFDQSYAPVYPAIAEAMGLHGSALVRVHLSPSGSVKGATLARSSGYPMLDDEALLSVRSSSYKAETVNCSPVEGDYLVEESFE